MSCGLSSRIKASRLIFLVPEQVEHLSLMSFQSPAVGMVPSGDGAVWM